MNEHSKVIEFGSKANADSYIAAGWEPIETRAEPFVLGKTIIVYLVGWTLASLLGHRRRSARFERKAFSNLKERRKLTPA
jgi:hypothetical protein